ncbi:hypothetical protein CC80DRAFT_279258 [Byssothecium circinans]|uniref:Uncharacterized protein n=1 Tax=Byssothecium circinans TaxID=147558 RepID=A0A6A5TAQ6_9PLEO|nr:hypothetical protein CC80DRAFT_279258 [Byssothecium circinans]
MNFLQAVGCLLPTLQSLPSPNLAGKHECVNVNTKAMRVSNYTFQIYLLLEDDVTLCTNVHYRPQQDSFSYSDDYALQGGPQ